MILDLLNHPRRKAHIVIPIVAGIGNALMAIPMVQQLKAGFPQSRISIVARTQAMKEVFDRVAAVETVRKMHAGSLGMARSMRIAPRPDVCIVPFPSNRWQYTLLALASGAKHRVIHSYAAGYFKTLAFLPALRLPAVQGLHDVVQNLYLLRMLGIEPDISTPPVFPTTQSDLASASKMLQAIGVDPASKPILIHAGSSLNELAAAKRWSPQHFASLLCEIPSISKNPIVLIEGPDEIGISDEIQRHCLGAKPPVLHLCGPLGIAAGILQLASMHVGCDSGLAHLAAAVGTPPVTLFAPTDPERRSPFGYRDLCVQPRGKTCSPCCKYPFLATKPSHQCAPPWCINDIRIEDVLQSMERALKMH